MVCRTDTERASLSPDLSNSHQDTQFLPSFSHVPFPSVSIHHVLFYSQMHCPSLLAGPLFGDWWQLSQRGHVCKDTQGSFLRRAASFFSHGNGTARQNFSTKHSKTFSHLLSANLQNYDWIIIELCGIAVGLFILATLQQNDQLPWSACQHHSKEKISASQITLK